MNTDTDYSAQDDTQTCMYVSRNSLYQCTRILYVYSAIEAMNVSQPENKSDATRIGQ